MHSAEHDPLTTLPDIRYVMLLNPPWELALKARSDGAWETVKPLLDLLCGARQPFKQFAEWAICVLSLALLDAGERVSPDVLIQQVEDQGETLLISASLLESTRKPLEVLHRHPREHFMAMMTDAVALLSGKITPSDDDRSIARKTD